MAKNNDIDYDKKSAELLAQLNKPFYETEYGRSIGATKENPYGKYKTEEAFLERHKRFGGTYGVD